MCSRKLFFSATFGYIFLIALLSLGLSRGLYKKSWFYYFWLFQAMHLWMQLQESEWNASLKDVWLLHLYVQHKLNPVIYRFAFALLLNEFCLRLSVLFWAISACEYLFGFCSIASHCSLGPCVGLHLLLIIRWPFFLLPFICLPVLKKALCVFLYSVDETYCRSLCLSFCWVKLFSCSVQQCRWGGGRITVFCLIEVIL